ncbi:MAG: uracil phosphoribosyltransferase [Bacteroidota bacterium]|nr:uracil phosphoribosyltransferase [Bacteroidota bacterium]
MINILSKENSILNKFIAELRNIDIQKDSLRFRKNMERIGEIFAYEISKQLYHSPHKINTPLGVATTNLSDETIVNATILRAGLPLHQGILNYFDNAENAFISAHREYTENDSFEIKFGHISGPSINNKTLILSDPMLASGASMLISYNSLLERGTPTHTHIVAIISSKEGLEYLEKNIDSKNLTIWIGAVDDELSSKSYIIPGLGDAGDLAYGEKM